MILAQNITIQDTIHSRNLFSKKVCSLWLSSFKHHNISLTIRIVDELESQLLNNKFRNINKPTNILSFLIDENPIVGDLILCHPIIKKEARDQNIKIKDHYAHLLIHGYLHLTGLDHEKEKNAQIMENKEIAILKKLRIKNPYKSNIIK